ncbi:SpoIIE family protein phosphatase [Pseudarthrobacter sp. HLT3-5]|uniref:PP2C family protein-serine/threonine phosphatase n=1 Tax=Pseudarthrobacter cellobiosi TaxID=2953654 RepID=UPI00208EA01B|nr:SpoIIE family protein phosphatase [Pseudarthrobacter sp. HLT3-5]MCO4275649.1 SpoIIE family protein phosphatase [Pseudarthrobacter sp. HLT3-5]
MPSMPDPRRAVVIEDDPDIRGLLVRILAKQGFEVTHAEAGLPGVEEVRRAKPDLITLDLNLPDVDGLEVCKLLREFSDAFIVMLTARADELDKLTGLDNGADDYISKPFSPRELQSRINALFRRRQPSAADTAADTAAASELERATEVQKSLLPQEDVRVDGYDVAGVFRPSRSVGGDFYDWYRTPEGLHLTFADAMGKGMGAALIAATVRAVMRSTGQRQDLDAAFASASTTIAADLDSSNSFVTLFHARLDAASGVVSYVDAGHGLALHVTADGSADRLPSGGPPVGAWAGSAWPQSAVGLAPGDSLVVVSDGVLDVFESVEQFTEAVLAAAHGQVSAQSASDAIMALAPAETAEDDVTVVVVRRLPEPAPA